MRPPSVYANRACPAGDPCDLLRLLQGPHRVGYRLVMIPRSQRGWPAATIASLLGCDPRTVRRWVHRYHQTGAHGLGDLPRPGRPRLGSPQLGQRIRRLLAQPRAWTIPRLWQQLGRPAMRLRTLHRRVGEVACWRRPRLVAKGDPDRDQVLTDLRQAIATLPQGAVVLAEDETHSNLLPWVRSTWIANGCRQQVMTPPPTGGGPASARSTSTAAGLSTRSAARRSAPASPPSASSCWPPTRPRRWWRSSATTSSSTTPSSSSAGWWPTRGCGCCTAHAPAPRQPDRADLGSAQGLAGQQPDLHHPGSHPPGPRLLPGSQPHPAAGHRRTAQLTLAPRGLRTEPPGGRLAPGRSTCQPRDRRSAWQLRLAWPRWSLAC
jgi:Winged helix-turn helix